ncbi:MAG TPA: biosynthetic-type acetolactate synthase large subunit [Treponemataceae bacterium]|jgi:acetolactate synthase-1/2/3 large subunit|nr:biosynthetic-type acetolactate synthase large subunit [Treponema sp.]OQB02844.1 MAG: Acetolactate synthase large subunit [Spirochaetes bacterium ADurb.Bin215]HOS34358.1 biosynthetic-type acetolactate synthase large subunit [Treponemataceae bacterium]HOU37630.1 biosynthetic-type acetolactate synthase large subunit [Treponemataceae bacterium]HPA09283.1 biosynthetic-type acetolactate synthase large subunit [Treponemataceae bacterium]
MKCTGAQIVIECLLEKGVDTVFGYPGGTILNIYDELYKSKDRINHIRTAHEQGACHAADGYARVSGKVGVVMATSGPGCTNLVTGIATAYMDSVPLVAITCNVPTHLIGKDSFQEVDITGITMSITKHNYIVRDVTKLADVVREAFDLAQCGRPGPVLIDIPKDITAAVTEFEPLPPGKASPSPAVIRCMGKTQAPTREELDEVAAIFSASKRPFFYVGGGVVTSEATAELTALAEKMNAAVSVSLMGKTAFPVRHPLCTGMIGMHGTKASNTAANKCDLLVAIGARFSDRVISDPSKFARDSKIVQIDIDPAEINKNIRTAACLKGDIRAILAELVTKVESRPRSDWNDSIDKWKSHVPPMYSKKTALHPKFVFEAVHERVGDDAIITTEVGQHQMWVAQFYPFAKPRTFLTSGGLGTMGYGTGAAIGAQFAAPDRRVVHIAGDGSFRMNMNELTTIAIHKLPIIIIIANNQTLGMVRQWQTLFYDKRYSATTLDVAAPDFVKYAEAFGIAGYRVFDEKEFIAAFDEALASGKPAVIDSTMDIDEMVLPMVPAGKPIDELMLDAQS